MASQNGTTGAQTVSDGATFYKRGPAPVVLTETNTRVAALERPRERVLASAHTGREYTAARWAVLLLGLDTAAVVAASILGSAGVFGVGAGPALYVLLPVVWLLGRTATGRRHRRSLLRVHGDARRSLETGAWVLTGLLLLSALSHFVPPRSLVVVVATVALLSAALRAAAARSLRFRISRGAVLHRVLVAGTPNEVGDVVRHIERNLHAGCAVVGTFARLAWPEQQADVEIDVDIDPNRGLHDELIRAARDAGADAILFAGTSALASRALRHLSWDLAGTGIDLVVCPALTDVAGPRMSVTPMEGLPLIQIQSPEYGGMAAAVKFTADRLAGTLLLLGLAPVLLTIAIAVRTTSPGPILFKQTRVGRNGRHFQVLKFRTMSAGADSDRARLDHLNERADGPLFKIRDDPRVTPVGRWLRRLSLDELPQLWNVLTGSMSLVGPRPPLPREAERYSPDVRRRLLVKPGITGLAQVSGRAELCWQDTVRLDLLYVENWSLEMDSAVLLRTLGAVVSRRGAY